MKKEYVAPELDRILFDINDIITHSVATSDIDRPGAGDDYSDGDYDDMMGGISANGQTISVFGIQMGSK